MDTSAFKTQSGHPDPETLAALLDGRLAGEEHRRVLAHLAGCDACSEVVGEAAAVGEELAGQDEVEGRVVAHPRSRRWGLQATVAAVAAAVLLAVVLPLVVERPREAELALAALAGHLPPAGRLETALGPGWDEHGWPVARGTAGAAGRRAAFRLGVVAVDLEVALAAGERERAARLVRRGVRLVDEVELAEPLLFAYRELGEELAAGTPTTRLVGTARNLDRLAAGLLTGEAYRFGKWAEAGRLAAAAGERDFFDTPTARAYAGGEAIPPPLTAAGEAARTGIASRLADGAGEADLPALERSFTALVDGGVGAP